VEKVVGFCISEIATLRKLARNDKIFYPRPLSTVSKVTTYRFGALNPHVVPPQGRIGALRLAGAAGVITPYKKPFTFQLSALNFELSATNYQLPATSYELSAVSYEL
jgi:hypothetical protein